MAIITLNNNSLSSVTSLPAAITTGSLVKLAETNVTSSTSEIVVDGHFSSTYDNYQIWLTDVVVTTPSHLKSRVYVSGSEQSGSYYYGTEHTGNGNSSNSQSSCSKTWGDSTWKISHWYPSSNAEDISNFIITINNPLDSTSNPTITSWNTVLGNNFDNLISGNSMLVYNQTTAISGIKFSMNSGNFSKANCIVYGVKN
jgi:hypothetical protein